MKVVVTKANKAWWYKIRVFNTIEDIQKFISECRCEVIIEKNRYTNDNIFEFWKGMKAEDIPTIKECPLHLTIYNDYIE